MPIFILNLIKSMMKNLFILAVIAFMISSCQHMTGSGNIVKEKRNTGNFKRIDVGGAFEVELKNGPQTSVEVEADDNLLSIIETRVNGDELNIHTKGSYNITDGHFKVYITAPEIKGVKSTGAANFKALDVLKSDEQITFEASGAGNIKAAVDAPKVKAESSGAGDIELSGRTKDYTVNASGGGNVKSANLLTETTDADVSGAGSVHVHASVSLKAEASGAGSVYYRGGANVSSNTSGAGSVKKED